MNSRLVAALVLMTSLCCLLWALANEKAIDQTTPSVLRASQFSPWDLSEFRPWKTEEEGPVDAETSVNSDEGIREVIFKDGRDKRRLYVHFPAGDHASKSLPCVLVPPSGSNLVTGQSVNGNHVLLNHYLDKQMVVVTYELSGDMRPEDSADQTIFKSAYLQFVQSKAGLINSLNAFHYATTKVDVVDPTQVFVAGFSSGGSHALLFAAHEQRLAGCVAYCPDTTMGDFTPRAFRSYGKFLPGLKSFVTKVSPISYINRIHCPVLVFAAMDDDIIDFAETSRFCNELRKANGSAMFRWSKVGGHFEAYEEVGIKQGADWIEKWTGIR